VSGADRSRLASLREERQAALAGRDALEQKLELLRRELLQRTARRDRLRTDVARALGDARAALRSATVEVGIDAVEAAALAQPEIAAVAVRVESAVGVPVPRLTGTAEPFRACYGPAGTAASLDAAGRAHAAALPLLWALASEEAAVRALRRGQRRTARLLNALEKAILPALDRELRAIATSLEEEERQESVRRLAWLRMREAR